MSRGFNATAVFKGCQVVLCTLSTLSSSNIVRSGITKCVPIKTLVVDEASQIEVGDYFSVFYSHNSIRKMCFIGDDKQCTSSFLIEAVSRELRSLIIVPPFGKDDNDELKSVFELQNLRKQALFLDTQCLCSAPWLPAVLVDYHCRPYAAATRRLHLESCLWRQTTIEPTSSDQKFYPSLSLHWCSRREGRVLWQKLHGLLCCMSLHSLFSIDFPFLELCRASSRLKNSETVGKRQAKLSNHNPIRRATYTVGGRHEDWKPSVGR